MTGDADEIGTVVIDGFYGHGNAGDEAILASIVQRIRSFDPEADVIASTADPAYTTALHDVDDAVRRYDPRSGLPNREWLAAVRRADQFWIGGGGLFGERKMLRYALASAIARGFGTEVATVCVGSGPIDEGNRLVAPLLSHAGAVTVRDEFTAETLRRAGGTGRIDVLADPVFGYDRVETAAALPPTIDDALSEDAIAVALRAPADGELDATAIAGALSEAAAERDARVVFLPFHCRRSDAPSDVTVARRVAAHQDDAGTVCTTELTYRQLLDAIERADVLVGMRLHSVVFAALVGTPFVGLPYAPKCASHLRRLGARADLDCRDVSTATLGEEIRTRWREGMPSETDAAVADCRETARSAVPTIQSQFAACSRLRTPALAGVVAVDGALRLVPGVTR